MIAYKKVVAYLSGITPYTEYEITSFYKESRKQISTHLVATASSHNRMLYFQRMLELMKLASLDYALTLYNIYWNVFINNMDMFEEVDEILCSFAKDKICIVTDLTANIQFRKVKRLKLDRKIKYIVTSEEAGKEKPNPEIFHMALQKLNMQIQDVIMVGDDYKKDILGASSIGIKSFWFNRKNEQQNKNHLVTEFKNFAELKECLL